MSRYVIDVNVALKWFLPEPHTDAALVFLDDAHDLRVPDLFWPELGSILTKKANLGEVTQEQVRAVVRGLRAAPLEAHPAAPHLELALEIAASTKRSVYESVYVALAMVQRCRLVTADRSLYAAVHGSLFADHVQWIEDRS